MVLCLVELHGKRQDCCGSRDRGTGEFEEWTDLIERGGLCHVKQMTFQLCHTLEYQVRLSEMF